MYIDKLYTNTIHTHTNWREGGDTDNYDDYRTWNGGRQIGTDLLHGFYWGFLRKEDTRGVKSITVIK